METIVIQELAIRAAIPAAIPPAAMPAEGTILEKDASATTPTYRVVSAPKGKIPVLTSPPAADPDNVAAYFLKTGGVIDYDHIYLLFPDNSDHNKCIVLSDIVFQP